MDHPDCARVAIGRHCHCRLFRLDTGKGHRCANFRLRRDGVRGDYFAGDRVRALTATVNLIYARARFILTGLLQRLNGQLWYVAQYKAWGVAVYCDLYDDDDDDDVE